MFLRRLLSIWITISFLSTLVIGPQKAYSQDVLNLPKPGTMVSLSSAYTPVLIKGLKINPKNPLSLDFIVATGNSHLTAQDPALKKESEKLIKYFFAALTLPERDVWVNLSPYEKDRIVPKATGETEMGRDMLAQDYILKQITASLIYPEKGLGKEFWNKVYAEASERFGTTQIPVNTFNKVWIVADKASVYEAKDTVFVVDAHLKVMLEEDYLALSKHVNGGVAEGGASPAARNEVRTDGETRGQDPDIHRLGSQIVREIVLPALEKEVNEGKNFANLRQIFHSLILAKWYKETLKTALLNQVYSNKNKIGGLSFQNAKDMSSPNALIGDPQYIYQQYLKAYKKGVFNYIKEDVDQTTQQPMPRKYFSGGVATLEKLKLRPATLNAAMKSMEGEPGRFVDVTSKENPVETSIEHALKGNQDYPVENNQPLDEFSTSHAPEPGSQYWSDEAMAHKSSPVVYADSAMARSAGKGEFYAFKFKHTNRSAPYDIVREAWRAWQHTQEMWEQMQAEQIKGSNAAERLLKSTPVNSAMVTMDGLKGRVDRDAIASAVKWGIDRYGLQTPALLENLLENTTDLGESIEGINFSNKNFEDRLALVLVLRCRAKYSEKIKDWDHYEAALWKYLKDGLNAPDVKNDLVDLKQVSGIVKETYYDPVLSEITVPVLGYSYQYPELKKALNLISRALDEKTDSSNTFTLVPSSANETYGYNIDLLNDLGKILASKYSLQILLGDGIRAPQLRLPPSSFLNLRFGKPKASWADVLPQMKKQIKKWHDELALHPQRFDFIETTLGVATGKTEVGAPSVSHSNGPRIFKVMPNSGPSLQSVIPSISKPASVPTPEPAPVPAPAPGEKIAHEKLKKAMAENFSIKKPGMGPAMPVPEEKPTPKPLHEIYKITSITPGFQIAKSENFYLFSGPQGSRIIMYNNVGRSLQLLKNNLVNRMPIIDAFREQAKHRWTISEDGSTLMEVRNFEIKGNRISINNGDFVSIRMFLPSFNVKKITNNVDIQILSIKNNIFKVKLSAGTEGYLIQGKWLLVKDGNKVSSFNVDEEGQLEARPAFGDPMWKDAGFGVSEDGSILFNVNKLEISSDSFILTNGGPIHVGIDLVYPAYFQDKAAIANIAPEGGIDFNASRLKMQRTGSGIDIKFDPAMIERFKRGNFDGIVPVITSITPIANIYSLLI